MRVDSINFLTHLKNKNTTLEEFMNMDHEQQMKYYCSRIRRSCIRLKQQINKYSPMHRIYANALSKPNYKIQKGNFIIFPQYINKHMLFYNGKSYEKIKILPTMIGKRIGMFFLRKKFPNHNKGKTKKIDGRSRK